VGVVADVRDTGLDRNPEPTVYVPAAQVPDALTALNNRRSPLTWVVRTLRPPEQLRADLERELRTASGGLPMGRVRSMEEVVASSTARVQFNLTLLSVFGATALLLAGVGLYGLMAYSVEQRTQEIGIRLAVGARPEDVRNMFVWQGMRAALAGVAIGIAGALSAARLMAALVFGVGEADPVVFVSVAAVLSAVTLTAAWVPARRALRVDPGNVLRT
jgi:predicted lysophospholipase L1 biosynthesis ABC-type transport system permease subunit